MRGPSALMVSMETIMVSKETIVNTIRDQSSIRQRSAGSVIAPAPPSALSQPLDQIKLAQSVEAGIGIGFAVRGERRIDQRNPGGVGWPDFPEQLAAAGGQIHAHHIRRIAAEHRYQHRTAVVCNRKDRLLWMNPGNRP